MDNKDLPAFPIVVEYPEEWRDIGGYEGLYQISNYGRVKSIEKIIRYSNGIKHKYPETILKIKVNKRNGYCYIGLYKNKKLKGFRVHRLVAIHFIENPLNLPEVNHEDFDLQNNYVDNLKWCDRYYNNQHAAKKPNRKWQNHRLGKIGKENFASKPVKVYTVTGKNVGIFESGHIAAKALNCEQSKISACCLGKRKQHKDYIFQFAQ